MLHVERMFRGLEDTVLLSMINVKETLINKAEILLNDVALPSCHNVKRKLLSKYFNVRLSIFCKVANGKRLQRAKGSKTDFGSR